MVSRKQYFAIKNTLTTQEKALIDFYELQWVMRHRVPTIEEVALQLGIKQVAVNYYLQRKPVTTALDQRGIKWQQHTQGELTATQVATAITMMNFADTRSNDVKLDQLGVNPTQYYAWLNDPQFKNLVQNLADENIKNIQPTAIGEFTKLINKGDWNAVKYYLDNTGALKGNAMPESEALMRMLIEIIQTHVKDPEIIIAIAEDLKLATANRTLEVAVQPQSQVQIQGQIVEQEDLELLEAKRILGI